MTSSTRDTDLKRNNFRRTIHPKSFIAVAFIFSGLDGGGGGCGAPPGPDGRKKESRVWIGLKEQFPGFSTILRSSKTYLYRKKPNNNGFILENNSLQMIRTRYEVRMANDD